MRSNFRGRQYRRHLASTPHRPLVEAATSVGEVTRQPERLALVKGGSLRQTAKRRNAATTSNERNWDMERHLVGLPTPPIPVRFGSEPTTEAASPERRRKWLARDRRFASGGPHRGERCGFPKPQIRHRTWRLGWQTRWRFHPPSLRHISSHSVGWESELPRAARVRIISLRHFCILQ